MSMWKVVSLLVLSVSANEKLDVQHVDGDYLLITGPNLYHHSIRSGEIIHEASFALTRALEITKSINLGELDITQYTSFLKYADEVQKISNSIRKKNANLNIVLVHDRVKSLLRLCRAYMEGFLEFDQRLSWITILVDDLVDRLDEIPSDIA